MKQTIAKPGLYYFLYLVLLIANTSFGQIKEDSPELQLQAYRLTLDSLRSIHTNIRNMPDIKFYLFGMGDRKKIIYKDGKLFDAITGNIIRQWKVTKEFIVPPAYLVYLETADQKKIRIQENEEGVFICEGNKRTTITKSRLHLPSFEGHAYASVLRVLHQEILINVNNGLPVPNFMVYRKPWFRDATLMGMVMKQTGNLHLIKDWIMNIRDPFDRNNHGISEADNPGQVLYLISLVSDKTHPAIQAILDSVKQFQKGNYIEGKTDYSPHPVFQTKWIKYGLKSLGLENLDTYTIPKVYDSYSSLFWWDYKEQHVNGDRFPGSSSVDYPYLVWAEDHFFGDTKGIVTNRDYPLSWESNASDANYAGLKVLDEDLVSKKLSPPHTWHAAEMFLLLFDKKQ